MAKFLDSTGLQTVLAKLKEQFDAKQDKLPVGTDGQFLTTTASGLTWKTLDLSVFTIVTSLPDTGESNKIYLVKGEGVDGNIYTEYVFADGKWEKFGEYKADVDLSEYAKTEEVEGMLEDYVKSEDLETQLGDYATTEDLDKKIDAPETGTTGQFLAKTESGVEWKTVDECECEELTTSEIDDIIK